MNAVQHPGVPSRQAIQSVGVHLVRWCLVMERGLRPDRADVDAAQGVEEHAAMVRSWAAQMWQVWSPHHATVRAWASGVS